MAPVADETRILAKQQQESQVNSGLTKARKEASFIAPGPEGTMVLRRPTLPADGEVPPQSVWPRGPVKRGSGSGGNA